ncbi:Hypothetical predicted protein [Octopus vulgaris]|uniref:Uracil-DNA glycosylase-like domain-containing protein n=1 Tax=Octopus vulgaris TaxID=6645 RepID=A0AA36C0U0_OCTVU|nr:Hypothetical predicted protein [Octopus vulgaris]
MNIGSPYYYPYQMGPAPVPPIYGAPLQAVKIEPDSNLGKMMKGKRKIKAEPIEENIEMSKPNMKKVKQEKITDHMPVKKKRDRFHGMSEEEVMLRTLPDHLQPNLDIVIIGFNPGLTAAYVGHHYAGPGNHFWKCLHLSELIPEPMTAYDDSKLLNHGIGFTNIVERTTRGSGDLRKKSVMEGNSCWKNSSSMVRKSLYLMAKVFTKSSAVAKILLLGNSLPNLKAPKLQSL